MMCQQKRYGWVCEGMVGLIYGALITRDAMAPLGNKGIFEGWTSVLFICTDEYLYLCAIFLLCHL